MRARLCPDPRAQVDFTAYTLEPGAVRIGVGIVAVGLLPRTQLGTAPIPALAGVITGFAKWNAVRVGPVDLAVSGGLAVDADPDYRLRYGVGGAHLSMILSRHWSVHTSARYHVASYEAQADGEEPGPGGALRGLVVRVASDLRFNRRDALVLRFATVQGEVEVGPPVMWKWHVDSGSAWTASVVWQIAWRTVQFRLGMAATSHPDLRLLPVGEVTLWGGGRTRLQERSALLSWRRARNDAP